MIQKSDIGLGFTSSNITFGHSVNCILDSLPSNICLLLTVVGTVIAVTNYSIFKVNENTFKKKSLSNRKARLL